MAKGKKKKKNKDLDFQKVKLKVGRKLKRDSNETKAEFKTRKIVIREVKNYGSDPVGSLTKHGDHLSTHGKLAMLNHFNRALKPGTVQNITKPVIDSLSKFLIDHSDQVRAATMACLKACYNQTKSQKLPTSGFMQSLKPYLDCALTHVSPSIKSDCVKFLDYFVNINDPQVFETIMAVVLRRYEAGTLSSSEQNLAIKLRRFYIRKKQKQLVEQMLKEDQVEPLVWTERHFFLDLDSCLYNFDEYNHCDPDREVFIGAIDKQDDVIGKYLSIVKDQDDRNELTNKKGNKSSSKKRRVL